MIKKIIFAWVAFFIMIQNVNADEAVDYTHNAWGIQGAIVTGGVMSVGVVNYGPHHSMGVFGGGDVSSGGSNDKSYVAGGFAGGRHLLRPQAYFAYGMLISTAMGPFG